uniref:Uncharacterized protein n=1 Tax=Aegilops tauschii subsp. strangulata TaxID=200361 RepID=A0A452YGX9_AEGTS
GKRSDRRAEREERKVRGVTGDWSVERQTPSGTPTNADERHCEVLSVCPQNPGLSLPSLPHGSRKSRLVAA